MIYNRWSITQEATLETNMVGPAWTVYKKALDGGGVGVGEARC